MDPTEIQREVVNTKCKTELLIRQKKKELEELIHKNVMEELQFLKDNKIKQYVRK